MTKKAKKEKMKVTVGNPQVGKQVVVARMQTKPDHKKIEAMRAYFIKNPPTIGIQAPQSSNLTPLKVLYLMDLLLPQYQRDYQHSRTEFIVQSIIRFGHIGSSIITVLKDKNGDIIGTHDGRHRLVASYILGEKIIMTNVVQFRTDADEIDYFNMVNTSKRPLSPEQRLYNEFEANWPLANLIYDLGYIDANSKWSGKVALRGADNFAGQMSVANFRKVVNWAGFGLKRRMEGEADIRALSRLQKMNPKDILEGVNMFHDWYYELARFPHPKGEVFVKDKVLISLLEFFYSAIRQDSTKVAMQPDKILRAALPKFRLYRMEQLQGFDASKAPDQLFEVFNGTGERTRVNKVYRLE